MSKFNDLTGKKFGRWTVLYRASDYIKLSGNRVTMWHCKCECGNERDVRAGDLKSGKTNSCGCLNREKLHERKFQDLTGLKFGRLRVIKRMPDYIKPSGGHESLWHCVCDCGNECDVVAYCLTSGHTQSCGCYAKEKTSEVTLIPMIGKKFGRLTVISRVEDYISSNSHREAVWLCKCECGNTCKVKGNLLRSGHTQSCGCYHKERASKANFDDLTGKKFGRLTVLYESQPQISRDGDKITIWHCKCDCGSECNVRGTLLRNGRTCSCGCYMRELNSKRSLLNLVGQRFGKLEVMYRADDYVAADKSRRVVWHCKCDCGNECDVLSHSLVDGNTISCGCFKTSKNEMYVEKYLKELGYVYNVDFVRFKSFPDLYGVGGGNLSYDFFVGSEQKPLLLIECQGMQHYKPINYFGGKKAFERQLIHDERKRCYANKMGIFLLEIPYSCRTYKRVCELLDSIGIL